MKHPVGDGSSVLTVIIKCGYTRTGDCIVTGVITIMIKYSIVAGETIGVIASIIKNN